MLLPAPPLPFPSNFRNPSAAPVARTNECEMRNVVGIAVFLSLLFRHVFLVLFVYGTQPSRWGLVMPYVDVHHPHLQRRDRATFHTPYSTG